MKWFIKLYKDGTESKENPYIHVKEKHLKISDEDFCYKNRNAFISLEDYEKMLTEPETNDLFNIKFVKSSVIVGEVYYRRNKNTDDLLVGVIALADGIKPIFLHLYHTGGYCLKFDNCFFDMMSECLSDINNYGLDYALTVIAPNRDPNSPTYQA